MLATAVTHAIPWFSAFTAVTELFVTVAIFYVIYQAWANDEFHGKLLAGALAYEVLFNITYMTSRLFTHGHTGSHPDWLVGLLAGHGILSLVMFLGLVAMSVAAYRWDQRGENLFARYSVLTGVFVVLWTISIVSGEAIFLLEYVGHY